MRETHEFGDTLPAEVARSLLRLRSPGEPLLLALFGAGGSAAIATLAGGAEAVEGWIGANWRGDRRRSSAGACVAEVMGGAATAEVIVRAVAGRRARRTVWLSSGYSMRRKRSASDERLPRRKR